MGWGQAWANRNKTPSQFTVSGLLPKAAGLPLPVEGSPSPSPPSLPHVFLPSAGLWAQGLPAGPAGLGPRPLPCCPARSSPPQPLSTSTHGPCFLLSWGGSRSKALEPTVWRPCEGKIVKRPGRQSQARVLAGPGPGRVLRAHHRQTRAMLTVPSALCGGPSAHMCR